MSSFRESVRILELLAAMSADSAPAAMDMRFSRSNQKVTKHTQRRVKVRLASRTSAPEMVYPKKNVLINMGTQTAAHARQAAGFVCACQTAHGRPPGSVETGGLDTPCLCLVLVLGRLRGGRGPASAEGPSSCPRAGRRLSENV